ncbi:MAG: MarR family EPS-associated transcriptional regulator [Desulfurella sp.]|uniref:MarR family EPS-associated transcriptional regulator n=1 Tax=Desulfurella sp. TaxID=1962857 RepID=UPI003D121AB7
MNFIGSNIEAELFALYELKKSPDLSQRALAKKLGVSLGKSSYILRSLAKKGLIKIEHFRRSNNKIKYLYFLTPEGLEEKARLTKEFIKFKIQEYEKLIKDLEEQ